MKKLLIFLLSLSLLLVPAHLCISVSAETVADHSATQLSASAFDYPQYLNDGKDNTYADSEGLGSAEITLTNKNGIAHIYVVFDKIYGEWTLTDLSSGKQVQVGKNSFLHEYIDVASLFGSSIQTLKLSFSRNAYVAEVYGFSEGSLPDWVQRWEAPLEKADILLLSSHSDDEQLFFAGVLPYYAGERAAAVQVVYLISHFDTHERPHEQLNGLWAVGIRNYPVISDFPDLYSESLEGAISAFEAKGCTYEDFTAFIVENIRRFKPQVLVTHDINGEYGHGTHIYCTDVVTKSLPSISDASFCPESAEKYGTWDVPKTYLHLYEENSITMNWDIPLEAFGGKTAFEMTVIGFSYHKSQHWTWFNDWIHGKAGAPVTKATDIKTYSPCLYGLYRTTVGADVAGGDFLENITLYKDQLPPAQVTPETEPPVTGSSEPTDTAPAADSSESVANGARSPVVLVAIILIVALAILMIYLIFSSKNKNRR